MLEPAREVRDLECRLLPVRGAASGRLALDLAPVRQPGGARGAWVLIARDLREADDAAQPPAHLGAHGRGGRARRRHRARTQQPARLRAREPLRAGRPLRAIEKELADSAAGIALAPVLLEAEEIVEESLEGIGRAAGIVRDVREFSHAGSGERVAGRPVRPGAAVRARGASSSCRRTPRWTFLLGKLPAIECEPQRLKQLFLNLLVNAAQAVGEGGRYRRARVACETAASSSPSRTTAAA